ncbi:BZ3500_MvSof-1268-A1-R1_Chr3-1g05578 [Microbotryum saponariae]|uniref:Sorting nexin MVP1 n=1 Tax=Microbotryum saponariae TaxID=289078 RepID=A0A2X0LIA8_9BASI|nr:BZ3500_MvSof-1268-A1-R1_Chr3-1g05578 [Microbotryum saponariae]SDA04768.1 BZ3501_MvSof-1269-A2-R1_Chr3-1g05248 [Microbotryum saponariae]
MWVTLRLSARGKQLILEQRRRRANAEASVAGSRMSGPLGNGDGGGDLSTARPISARQGSWADSSPWGNTTTTGTPTARRTTGSTHIHEEPPSLLPLLHDSNVPPLYLHAWRGAQPIRDTVSLGAVMRVLSSGGIKQASIDKASALQGIVSLVTPNSGIITKQQFYTSLVLLAHAQLHREISLQVVARAVEVGSLPIPTLSSSSASLSAVYSAPSSPTSMTSPPDYHRSTSMSSTNDDPWGTAPAGGSSAVKASGGSQLHSSMGASRPTFPPVDEDDDHGHAFGENPLGGTSLGEWALGKQQKVEVRMRDELKGLVFKHTIWFIATEVSAAQHPTRPNFALCFKLIRFHATCSQRGVIVERRYSDFVWLHDCLVRRYPFRLLPVLPPKQVHIPGYIAIDELFLERRRRGLERFLVALLNHPTLKHDHLVRIFHNEQSELSAWRKSNPISLEEESTSRILTSEEEMSVPSDLEERLTNLRARIIPLVEHWTRVTTTIDRIAHRRQNQAAEYERMTEALSGAVECERTGWRPVECENVEADVDKVARGLRAVAGRVRQGADEQLETTVEELKRHRELYVNMKELFTRYVHLSTDNVDKLKRRVETNMKKLEVLRDAATPLAPAEFDKLSHSISTDQRSIELLLRRRSFVRWCMWQEVLWMFRSTSLLSTATRVWVTHEVAGAEHLRIRWEELQEGLDTVLTRSAAEED